MAAEQDHLWAAAVLYHLAEVEATAVAEPESLPLVATLAPQEVVGAVCLDRLVLLHEL